MVAGCQGNYHVIRGLELLVPPLTTGKERGAKDLFIHQWPVITQACLFNAVFINPLKGQNSESFWVDEHMEELAR